ncbi:MAG: hypothetical protein DRJ42_21390 [Deltaproteobacteria bacterium]|nr:MAG: hypothetical protein DRJ42_21390 [Deltaproteobacteria bacterium]
MIAKMRELFHSTGHDPDAPARRRLGADDRGAMMVMGIFMAVILVGAIYYVLGIGASALYHERMQDAADSGAFGAAVIHARGMNILAILNLISAAVMAVLVAIKVIEYLLLAALAIATAICLACSCPGCCGCCAICPVAVVLEYGYDTVSEIRNTAEPLIEAILEVSKAVQTVTRYMIPVVAEAKVIKYGSDTFSAPTTVGLMAPGIIGLAVEPDESDLFCKKASNQGGRLAGTLIGIWPIRSFVGTAVESLSSIFCEDDEYAHRVQEDSDMGDDTFQLQVVMLGEPPFERSKQGVGIVTWGREDTTDYDTLETMTKFSYAQSEYYTDDPDRKEWLWRLEWRARLRRFTLGSSLGGILSSVPGISELDYSVH